jgi:hypothetical protein
VCDLETSRIGAPYIYDISNLRVKALYEIIHTKWVYPKKHAAAERVPNPRLLCEKS